MSIVSPPIPGVSSTAPDNPTDEQRHELLRDSLCREGRPEDLDNIINLLSPPQDIIRSVPPGELKNVKVGIIGGGLAGMSAAFELRKLGCDITIFEPNTERIGGRVYTCYFDEDKRLYGELGAMRVPVSHEITWHYINLFKLNTEPFIQTDPNTFTYVRDVRVRNDPEGENIFYKIYPRFNLSISEKNTPWPELYRNINRYYLSTLPPEIRKQFLTVMPKYDPRHEALMDMSLRDAMRRYGLSNEAINLIVSLMPLVGGMIYHSYESTLVEEYSMDFLNLYQISGGMVKLPLAFYRSLTSPNPAEYPDLPQYTLGRINCRGGLIVTGIHKSPKDSRVMLSYSEAYEHRREYFADFDYVICTVPFPTLRLIDIAPSFSGEKMQAIREMMYEDAYKALYLCSERFWEKQGIYGGSSHTDLVIQSIIYLSNPIITKNSYNEPGVLNAVYNMSIDSLRLSGAFPDSQLHIISRDVEKVHGLPRGYLGNIVMEAKIWDWAKAPWCVGAFQMFLPGQKRDFMYVATTPEYNNRLFFAGEHTSAKNAWMQGALQSGMKAAGDVAYYCMIHKYQK